MAKLKTEKLFFDGNERNEFSFSFDINVNKDGTFTTTLPKDIVELFKEAKIAMNNNKLGNEGYFVDSTCDGLINQVKNAGQEYMSMELISEKIVLSYCIQTRCSYSFDKDGNVIPNPSSEWSGVEELWNEEKCNYDRFSDWKQGTVHIDACHPTAFGFLIYARPFVKREYKYKSGKTKIDYKLLCYGGEIAQKALEDGYYLRWLESVPCIAMPKEGESKEIEYSESVCEFFVNMIKSIALMNEKIKDFLEPDAIKLIAEQKTKFLS